jgi:2-phosphosulfolactate phosphatase
VIACGEQWTSFSQHTGLRPSIEDWLGAGAIASALAELGHPLSAEAELAAASFESQERRLIRALSTCVSGRELIERGFDEDVLLAAELDAAPVTVRRADDDNERAFIAH